MFRSKNPIGVDIGSHTVKVCQVRKIGEGYQLENFGAAEVHTNGESVNDVSSTRQLKIDALKRALETGNIKGRHAVSAVSGESIIVRYLQLPEMPEVELKKALQWEAEEYIPFRLSEVNLDSQILGHVNDGDHPKMDVLLVSAKKDLVDEHVEIIKAAGLEPMIVDVDSLAFMNCFEMNYEPSMNECLALLNIGGEITSINIFSDGVSRFSRDILIGGDTMTQAIKSRLGCTYEDAERMKIGYGVSVSSQAATGSANDTSELSGSLMNTISSTVNEMTQTNDGQDSQEGQVQSAIQHSLHNLFSEIHRSIEFFENQFGGELNVSRVVVGGGTALLPNLGQNLEQGLNLPVEIIDPLKRVQIAMKHQDNPDLDRLRYQLGVGIGLGIRGLAA
jgi:type IV pilus assembly protein PilM